MIDLEPSVPRTPAQSVLRIVSIIMGIVGVVVLLGGVVVLATNILGDNDVWSVTTFGVMIVAAAGLLLLTAALGLAASDDAARVGPYRFLCYLVGLAVLVAIVWGWGLGTFILFNPIVLSATIVYVLICSTLADKVKDEHDRGVTGETFLRSRHQRVLHALSEVVIVKGVLGVVVAVVFAAALVVYGEGERAVITGIPLRVSGTFFAVLAAAGLTALLTLLVGGLGVRGSNRPEKIRPFLALASVSLVLDAVQAVVSVVEHGILGLTFDLVFDVLFMAACVWCAVRILRQPTPDRLAAAAGMAVAADDERADA